MYKTGHWFNASVKPEADGHNSVKPQVLRQTIVKYDNHNKHDNS